MRWIHKTRTLLLNEHGSVYVDYVVIYAAIACVVSVIMTVVTEERFELGGEMADSIERIASFSTDDGQANFGNAIYPGGSRPPVRQPNFRGVNVGGARNIDIGNRQLSLRSFFQSPLDQITLQPAHNVQVTIDSRGRMRFEQTGHRFTAVYNPRNDRWYTVHTGTGALMQSDLSTIQRLGFVESEHSLIRMADLSLGVPMTAPMGSGTTIIAASAGGAIVAGLRGLFQWLARRLGPGSRVPPTIPLRTRILTEGQRIQGRFPQTARPDQILYRADSSGRITHYQVYGRDGLPLKRVDLQGAPHGGIPTPHVHEYIRNIAPDGRVFVRPGPVRSALPSEIP